MGDWVGWYTVIPGWSHVNHRPGMKGGPVYGLQLKPAGGNFLLADGRVEWRNFTDTKRKYAGMVECYW